MGLLKLNIVFYFTILASFTLQQTTKPAPTSPQFPDLGGDWRWKETPEYRVEQTGNNLKISVKSGKLGPYFGNFTSSSSVSIRFGPRCCTGQIKRKGTVIEWSNKTKWNLSQRVKLQISKEKAEKFKSLTNHLSKTRKKILDLATDLHGRLTEILKYGKLEDSKNLFGKEFQDIATTHNSVQDSLKAAHDHVHTVEKTLNGLTVPQVTPVNQGSSSAGNTSPPEKWSSDDQGLRLQNWFQVALRQAQAAAQGDIQSVDDLLKKVADERKEALKKVAEGGAKRQESFKKTLAESDEKRAERSKTREQVRKSERLRRSIAYENFRKRNPSDAEIKRVDELLEKERELREKLRKSERESRKKSRKEQSKKFREEQKKAREEQSSKREQAWRSSMKRISQHVQEISNGTIATLSLTIQNMQKTLENARNELYRIKDSCKRATHLQQKYNQATGITKGIEKLTLSTLGAFKAATQAVEKENKRHVEKEAKRREKEEQEAAQDRLEDRNKRRESERQNEAHRKRVKQHRKQAREEKKAKREEYKKKLQEWAAESEKKRSDASQTARETKEKNEKKREGAKKQEEKQDVNSPLADQVKSAIQSVVEETKKKLQENLKQLNIDPAKSPAFQQTVNQMDQLCQKFAKRFLDENRK